MENPIKMDDWRYPIFGNTEMKKKDQPSVKQKVLDVSSRLESKRLILLVETHGLQNSSSFNGKCIFKGTPFSLAVATVDGRNPAPPRKMYL